MSITNYCHECNRPLKSYYYHCTTCTKKMKTTGHEPHRVKLGDVGRSTIAYQQSLHRQFFGCNAPVQYRGNVEDRIYIKIEKKNLEVQIAKLNRYLYTMNNKHGWLYRKIEHIPNISKRLIYNSVLFYLHYIYNKENQLFNTHLHLRSSLVMMVLISIENTYLRTNEESRANLSWIYQVRSSYNSKFYDATYATLEDICYSIINTMSFSD